MCDRIRSIVGATGFPAAVALLAAVAAPGYAAPAPTPPRPSLALSVDCDAGQTVGAALARAAYTFTPVVITITGVCAERALIRRDDVILQGAAPGAGLKSPPSPPLYGDALIKLDGARRITLYQLTLFPSGFDSAVELYRADASMRNIVVEGVDGQAGVLLWEGSAGELLTFEIRNCSVGVEVSQSALQLAEATIESGTGAGIVVTQGGTLDADTVTIHGRSSAGVAVSENSSARLFSTTVTESGTGISVFNNSTLTLGAGSRLADNESDGIVAARASTATAGGLIEGNFHGVRAEGGSVLTFGNLTIRDNRGSGISLADTSIVRSGSPTITGNAQWGVFCAPAPAVAHVTPPGFLAANVAGNGSGSTNCPALGLVDRIP
jgi:Right handed beta helix region